MPYIQHDLGREFSDPYGVHWMPKPLSHRYPSPLPSALARLLFVEMPPRYKKKNADAVETINIDVSESSEGSSEDEAQVAEAHAANDARAQELLAVVPTNVPAPLLITHLRDAQVLIGNLQDLLKNYKHREDARRKAPNTCSKCGKKTKAKLTPPPELEDLEEDIAYIGRVYSLLVCLWPPKEAFVMGVRPEGVDPERYEQRYPKYGDRGQALINARVAEFVDFLPQEFVEWLRNKWWKSVIARGINTHKCHMVANVKAVRGEIFQHIADLDTRLEFWRGNGELFAPIFYPNGDTSQKHHVFRNVAVLNTLMVMNYGRGALSRTQPPGSNTTAKSYGVDSVSNGMAAAAFVIILFLLSGSSTFRPSDWQPRFEEFVKFLMKKRETRAIKHLMGHLDYHLFSVPGGRHVVTALPHTDGDSDDEDWGALDEEFEEPAISLCIRPLRHQRDIHGASAVLRRARVTAISRALTATSAAAAAAVARRLPGSEYDSEGPNTPSTRLATPEGLDLSIVSRIPHDAESVSVSLSRVQFAALRSNDRQVPAALAARIVPMAPPAPAEQAAVVPDAPPKAPRQRGGTTKAPKNVQPLPAPVADVDAVPNAQAGNAPRARRSAATKAKASTNEEPVLPVPPPGQRRKASKSDGPSKNTPAVLAPVPDADAVKPKVKPKPRPVKKSGKDAGKAKAAAAYEEEEVLEEEADGEDMAPVRARRTTRASTSKHP
ncbi:hypothetical protein OH76DRAFT_1488644 [Lentinus brumalis]|uniref:Uncharacterized protein n=1 Tax=Lentinus brumalis TaxID=2498619 RepID=A0A371CQG6_9APHY|nr:hypothetical protein OH76DRAFT_1488644 [Polyporus brumalis]